jgi:hypothetical protein
VEDKIDKEVPNPKAEADINKEVVNKIEINKAK